MTAVLTCIRVDLFGRPLDREHCRLTVTAAQAPRVGALLQAGGQYFRVVDVLQAQAT